MEYKVIKEMQTLSMQLKLKMIWNNVEHWDTLWSSYEERYQEMTEEEMRDFNGKLHVLANHTINDLSVIRRRLSEVGVSFDDLPSESLFPGRL